MTEGKTIIFVNFIYIRILFIHFLCVNILLNLKKKKVFVYTRHTRSRIVIVSSVLLRKNHVTENVEWPPKYNFLRILFNHFLTIFIENNITYIILHYFGMKCADALQLAISFRTILVRTPSGSGREWYTIIHECISNSSASSIHWNGI